MIANYSISAQGVAVNNDGSSADGSAMLDVKSTDKGFLPPRMNKAERDAIISPVNGLVLWCTDCGVEGELQVYTGSQWVNLGRPVPTDVAIGDYLYSGVVFYLDGNGGGLVCAAYDQDEGSGIEWYNGDYTVTGAVDILIGTGQANTTAIINNQGAGSYAAIVSDNYTIGAYSDWFLPSKGELNAMFLNRAIIDSTSIAVGGSSFADFYYWSSSEFDNYFGWSQSFENGIQYGDLKKFSFRVRAVRAF